MEPNKWHLNPDGSWSFQYEGYPTYEWALNSEWVYTNPSMMEAIEQSVQNMLTYPDAERIINKLRKGNNEA